ncbi:rhamnulokinase [Jiangella asiatica]|uniref:rhamnulokinase n=1 Tax=Jiangella asiatica TaxID=2530372 RepID=UPI00193DCE1D|nr:rhamnulokinase family protein [Jiangella asiatica]
MSTDTYVAVDLGATSGRVIVGRVSGRSVTTDTVARFPNEPLSWPDGLHWNLPAIYQNVLDGVRRAVRDAGDVRGVGIDSWGVDYGLVGADGRLIGLPYHYRDARTRGLADELDEAALYRRTGVPNQEINTLTQLVAERRAGALDPSARLVFIADLLAYLLTGQLGAERTLASTSQLFDPAGHWSEETIDAHGLPRRLFPETRRAGDVIGELRAGLVDDLGLRAALPVRAVAAHDTASAVAAVPAAGDDVAYISCGTWALAGVELDRPIRSEASRAAGFTNELGAAGSVRYQKNLTALWILSECLRTWSRDGRARDLPALVRAAADVPGFTGIVDPDAPELARPGDMPGKIARFCERTGQPVPATEAETTRCVIDSLALAFAHYVGQAAHLSGSRVDVVHLVGGGANNTLLCQLTADATGLPVVAGPVEATALGNLLVQALGAGTADELVAVRAMSAASSRTARYEPRGSPAVETARRRFEALLAPAS